jgi:hypothetical protein
MFGAVAIAAVVFVVGLLVGRIAPMVMAAELESRMLAGLDHLRFNGGSSPNDAS